MEVITILSRGVCICKLEPRGDNGLEGYDHRCRYVFERSEIPEVGVYFRVYPVEYVAEDKAPIDFSPSFYYETCGVNVFRKFFDILFERDVWGINNDNKKWDYNL